MRVGGRGMRVGVVTVDKCISVCVGVEGRLVLRIDLLKMMQCWWIMHCRFSVSRGCYPTRPVSANGDGR